jgi:hypothetical protein
VSAPKAHEISSEEVGGADRRRPPDDDLPHEEELERGGEEDHGEEDAEDEGGAGSHASLRDVRVTGMDSPTGRSSDGADRVTSVPTGIASSAAAERLPRQTASIP